MTSVAQTSDVAPTLLRPKFVPPMARVLRTSRPVARAHVTGVGDANDAGERAGEVRDQAALHRLLARIRDTGIELVDVRQIPHAPGRPDSRPDEGRHDLDASNTQHEETS